MGNHACQALGGPVIPSSKGNHRLGVMCVVGSWASVLLSLSQVAGEVCTFFHGGCELYPGLIPESSACPREFLSSSQTQACSWLLVPPARTDLLLDWWAGLQCFPKLPCAQATQCRSLTQRWKPSCPLGAVVYVSSFQQGCVWGRAKAVNLLGALTGGGHEALRLGKEHLRHRKGAEASTSGSSWFFGNIEDDCCCL